MLKFTGCLESEWSDFSLASSVRIWTSRDLLQSHSSDCAGLEGKRHVARLECWGGAISQPSPQGFPNHKDVWRECACVSSLRNHHGNCFFFFWLPWMCSGWLSSLVSNLGFSHSQYTAVQRLCLSFFFCTAVMSYSKASQVITLELTVWVLPGWSGHRNPLFLFCYFLSKPTY